MTIMAPEETAVSSLPTHVRLERRHGGHHEPTSEYAELFWLPVIGPTALLLARRLARLPEGRDWPLPKSFGAAFGVGDRCVRSAPLPRAFDRLVKFGLGHTEGETFVLRVPWPHLRSSQRMRLPEWLRAMQPGLEDIASKERS